MTRYLNDTSEKVLSLGHRSAQVVYTAAGLTAWDTELRGRLSPETDQVLRLMFRLQQDNGTWKIPRNWPPLQSSPYQLATVAALAVATAQGWNGPSDDPSLRDQIGDLKSYLNETSPPHDYSRVWLLWAGSNLDGILPSDRKASILETIWNRQNEDGGWSLRSFAAPGDWGDGSRKANLEAEGDINSPASDGHMTGLVVVALREAGVPATDPRIQRAVSWMDSSQRISGRWWTQSLNSNKYHLITYSGTCFVLLSLWKCNALARPEP
jgi:squalene-hopene/tetraprenyl-beta-curcumene cyclase